MNPTDLKIYLDTPIRQLIRRNVIDRTVGRACDAAHPPMVTAGDVRDYLRTHGDFSTVPGCRRPGRITAALHAIADIVLDENTPVVVTDPATLAQTAAFSFLDENERREALDFKEQHGYLPMFRIVGAYFQRPDASRNDRIMAMCLGVTPGEKRNTHSFAQVAERVGLTRERVRQIAESCILPDEVTDTRFWRPYTDHSTYYLDASSDVYKRVTKLEVSPMNFIDFAAIIRRVAMLDPVEGRYLARRGWVAEIDAWVKRLERLAAMPRSIDSRLSIEGLAMGGSLDPRLKLVVLNQIAPTLGIVPSPPDSIILPKNT